MFVGETGDFLGWWITRADGASRGREVGLVGGMWPKTGVSSSLRLDRGRAN